jgi:arylsulfatase A-like enzyme
MKANEAVAFLGLAAVLLLSGCQPKSSPKNQATVFRLFDLFQPEDLTGKVTPEDVGWKRVEWQAQEMAPWTPPPKSDGTNSKAKGPPSPIGFHALKDLEGLKLDQGKLVGDITGTTPILHFSLKENRGGAESVKFIEVRMNVAGAKHAWLRPEGGADLEENVLTNWAAQSEKWNPSVELADGKVQTYRFELSSGRRGGGRPPPTPPATNAAPSTNTPPVTAKATNAVPAAAAPAPPPPPGGPPGNAERIADLRQFSLAFRECQSGKVSIESVRFVSEREEKLKDPSGQQWAGLAEIYHASLAAKSPESIRIPVRELPPGARLDFSYGTKEDAPVKFKITVSPRDRAKESAAAVVFERTVTIPNRWQTARIDLGGYAGKSVLLEFKLAGEQKGLWGYWGSPTVRGPSTSSGQGGPAGSGGEARRKPRGVIFVVSDTTRKDHLNIYGYHRETLVHLKKFAEEGVAFNHAISQGTWTKVSVPSMMTSLYPMTSTVLDMEHALPASAKTIAEVFRDEGYATVAYSSVAFTGKANNMHQGYDELHENGSISDKDYNSKTARHYVDRLIAWLKEHGDEPFFVFLHLFDPHSPFRPRPPYDTLWGAPGAKDRMAQLDADISKFKVPNKFGLPEKDAYVKTGNDPDELLKIYQDWYDGSIRAMDAEIGRLLEAMREMGLDRDTLVVWGADHGEEFWEHNQLFHGQSVYGELNQVPLVFRWPNSPEIKKGIMLDQQVQNLDIMPTILELAGIQGPTNMQGRSLLPLLNGRGVATWQEQPAITQTLVDTAPPPGSASTNKVPKPHIGIIERGWKLVRKEVDPEAVEELYEHPIDPLNLTNVIKSNSPSARVKPLEEALESWKTRAKAAQLPSDETMTQELSSEELRRLRALGYVGGGTTPKPATDKTASTNAVGGTNATAVTSPGTDQKDGGH